MADPVIDGGAKKERVWKSDLYQLQQEAPKPIGVPCRNKVVPSSELAKIYGAEFHGSVSHSKAVKLLTEDGMFLVRNSSDGQQTLSMRIGGIVKNYKVFYDAKDKTFYVKNKKFSSINELAADGLVTLYIEGKGGSYLEKMYSLSSYEQSPYMTLNRLKLKTIERTKKIKTKSCKGNNNNEEGEKKRELYDKAHAFKVHTFKGLHWCEFCGNFLWGFTAQGVKCDDCGFRAHHKCSERVPDDCCPDLGTLRGIFGTDLTTLTKATKSPLPFVVEMCVEEIERRGLANAEGLYRVSGFSDHVENLKMAFDKDGEKTELGYALYDNVNVIAGTLKLFLRLLPIPIITFEVHPMLCSAAEGHSVSEKVSALKLAINSLPVAHFHTLKYLVEHFSRVAAKAETNKMSAHNIATVFAPTLMPALEMPSLNSQGGIPGMDSEIAVIEAFIVHHGLIF